MTTINESGEFVDTFSMPRVKVRTDAEIREAALQKLVDMGAVRICDVCGKPFRTADKYRRNAKRCSWECKQEANRRNAREYKRKKHGYKPRKVDE